jgi:outer membrane lipoprotein SlyB
MTDLTPANPSTARYPWAAVGVLGAATIALGAVLLNPQWRGADAAQAPVGTLATDANSTAPVVAPTPPVALPESLGATEVLVPVAVSEPKSTLEPVKTAQAAPKKVAVKPAPGHAPVPKPVPAPTSQPQASPAVTTEWPAEPAAPAAPAKASKVVCAHCGTVQSVTPVQRESAKGSGVGVLVGGALGGLLGNQVGGGTGKTVATVLGAVGGGWAGNEVEKRIKKETVYQVTVRMQDGSTRQVEQNDPIAVGAAVTVEGDAIRLQTTPE